MKRHPAKTYPSRSLHGSIVHELGRRIVSGEYAPGTTLPIEEDLREELDVSRNALREGIKVLSAKGLLTVRPRTGTCVQPRERWNLTDPDVLVWSMMGEVDPEVIRSLTEFRGVIEPAAAEQAARRATQEQRRAIAECLAELERACRQFDAGAISIDECAAADMAFHGAIFSASGNPFLETVMANINSALALSRSLTDSVPGALIRSLPLHKRIGAAVIDARPEEARLAMVELCANVAVDVEAALALESGE